MLVDRDVPPGVNARCAAFDHASGMRAATEHLLELGHRNVALITGGPERPARERRARSRMALAARDGAHCSVYPGEFSVEHGRQATAEILASNPRPTAIIAGGNMLMQGALLALRDARHRGRSRHLVRRLRRRRDRRAVPAADRRRPPRHRPRSGSPAAELLLAELGAGRRRRRARRAGRSSCRRSSSHARAARASADGRS